MFGGVIHQETHLLDTDYNKKIQNCIMPQPQLDRQPDIYVDIRIPNEFETHGKFNIGITAGIETTQYLKIG